MKPLHDPEESELASSSGAGAGDCGAGGVVVALTTDPADPQFSLAVKIVSKVFLPSKGKEPSSHRAVSHTLHVQNEVAAMAKFSADMPSPALLYTPTTTFPPDPPYWT